MHYDIGYEKPISRVLFRLAAATIIYLGRRLPAGSSDSTRKVDGPPLSFPIWSCSMWGLPKPAGHPTAGALLPHLSTLTDQIGGLNFYGTVPKVTLAGRYPAHCPVELGLSSCIAKTIQAIVSVSHTNAEIIPHMAVRCQKSP